MTQETLKVPIPKDFITTLGSRIIFRHPNNEGSVIVYDHFGTKKQLFVADSKYRHTNKSYDSINRNHNLYKANATTSYFNSSSDFGADLLTYSRDDEWIQSTYSDLRNDGTSKHNTDTLMTFSGTEAAHYCRSVVIPQVGQCDLPNLYQLIILYLESDNIDNLDPTVNSNKDKALGIKNTHGRFNFDETFIVLSSTEQSATDSWNVDCYGGVINNSKILGGGIVPVKEL